MYVNEANLSHIQPFPFAQAFVCLCAHNYNAQDALPHFLGSNFFASFLDSPGWFKPLWSLGCVCISTPALDLIYSKLL